MRPDHPKPPWEPRKPTLPPVLLSNKLTPLSPRMLSRTAEGISIPWNCGDEIADKKVRKSLENAKKIHAKSVSTGMDHAFEILGEYSHDQSVCHLHEFGTSQLTTTSHGNLGLPHPHFTTMDMPLLQTRVNRPPGQPPTFLIALCRKSSRQQLYQP